MFKRIVNLPELLKKKSHFLFGPRYTGKSTLFREQLKEAIVFDLLDAKTYQKLLKNPSFISEAIKHLELPVVVIDEVQRIPDLLNEVHKLIFDKKATFLLTGSSARKLKHGAANLLAGRAWQENLFALTFLEIRNQQEVEGKRRLPEFDLLRYLNRGGIPEIYCSEEYKTELINYVDLYLREEVKAESLTRNIQAFSEFLEIVALHDAREVNFEAMASDCQIPTSTLRNYFKIIEDTLIGFSIPGYVKTKKRKATARVKHFLFDLGVSNSLAHREILDLQSEQAGHAFEHFMALELRAYLAYNHCRQPLTYWRSTSHKEVDFLIGDSIAIEVKASQHVNERHCSGLMALKEDGIFNRYLVVSRDEQRRTLSNGVEIWPYAEFIEALWKKEIC